jgi:hypothetical protein
MNKPLRVALVAFIVGLTMLLHTPNAFAEQGLTTVVCADPDGNEITRQIGWDNQNQFFDGRGYIPRLYCEGGFAGPYTTYISDTLPTGSPLGYYAGVMPTPEPTPEPSMTIEPTPEPTPLPSVEPSPTPSLEPTPEPSPEPTLEPSPTPTPPSPEPVEPTQSPEPEPTPTSIQPSLVPVEPTELPSEPTPVQTPEPEPTQQPTPVAETPEPTAEPSPTPIEPSPVPSPIPSLDPQVVALEVPTQLMAIPGIEELAKAAEAIMNIGSDMTPEQREESQSVVIGAVLVGQIAASIRKVK